MIFVCSSVAGGVCALVVGDIDNDACGDEGAEGLVMGRE